MRRILYNLLAPHDLRHALKRLRWLEQKLPTPELRFAVPPAFRGRRHFKTMKIMQHGREILELYEIILRDRPKRVLEIGTAMGGTLYLWTQAAADDAVIISLDLPGGPFGGGYPVARAPFYRAFVRPGQTLHLLRGDSLQAETTRRVADLAGEDGLDFLFIDADHSYAGVRGNVCRYAPLVRPGGLIAMHDILPNPRDSRIEVWRLWEQLRGRPEASEIVGREEEGRPLGIGVVRVPEGGMSPWLRELECSPKGGSHEDRADRDSQARAPQQAPAAGG